MISCPTISPSVSLKTKGFFRGLGFPLVSYGLVNSVFFGVYGHTIKLLKGADQKRGVTYKEVFCAGCVGGFVQNFVACPVDLVKVVLQSQISNQQSEFITGVIAVLISLDHSILPLLKSKISLIFCSHPIGECKVAFPVIRKRVPNHPRN